MIYINDLAEFCRKDSEFYLFADDAKLFKYVKVESDCEKLQSNLYGLQEWSDKWLLRLNSKKCKVISFGRQINIKHVYKLKDKDQMHDLERVETITDLGVNLDTKLSFSDHIQAKINKAYSMIGLIKRNFSSLSVSSFVMLYKSMVRSHLDYCNSVWAPYKKCDVEDLEKVQRRATKILPALKKLSYADRLKRCGLPTLSYRRVRGDMIETYKILSGKYDESAAPALALNDYVSTRGNDLKLQVLNTRYELRKHFFTCRIIAYWNSLPNEVILADSTNIFKKRLDKFWQNQDIIFDYKSEITGIGNRSSSVKV